MYLDLEARSMESSSPLTGAVDQAWLALACSPALLADLCGHLIRMKPFTKASEE